jgi:hypothetical protein
MTPTRLAAVLLVAALIGCASGGTPDRTSTPRTNAAVLTQADMQRANFTNLYDAIAALRGNWIRQQPPSSFSDAGAGQTQVFMEATLLGDVNALRQFQVSGVESIRYLNVSEAAARFGLQAKSGPALVIVPSRGG